MCIDIKRKTERERERERHKERRKTANIFFPLPYGSSCPAGSRPLVGT